MANVAVDAAIKSLQAIGIPIPSYMDGFIELLVDAGEDVLTAVPHIISVTEQLGTETWSTLEEVVSGMQLYGPQGYIRRKIDAAFDPHIETIRTIHRNKQALYEYHQGTLTTLQKQVDTLYTGPQSFTGPAATQAQTHFTTLKSQVSNHLDLLNQSMAIDQKFFTDVQNSKETATDAALVGLIIMGIILVVALALAAFSGGASLAVIGVGTVGVSAEEAGALAIVAGCFVAWGIAHELLAHPISINQQPSITLPASHPLISADSTLPVPEPTAKDIKMANDLFEEFGRQIPEDVLKYLVTLLGASPLTAAMIRCLYQSGYLNISMPGGQAVDVANGKIWANVVGHLKSTDLEGAWKEYNPDQVDPSTITNPVNVSNGKHDEEVEGGINAIENFLELLSKKIGGLDKTIRFSPDPTKVANTVKQRSYLQKLYDVYNDLKNFIRSSIAKGSPSPDTWPDKGQLPLLEDLLKSSTCNVPGPQYFK